MDKNIGRIVTPDRCLVYAPHNSDWNTVREMEIFDIWDDRDSQYLEYLAIDAKGRISIIIVDTNEPEYIFLDHSNE